MKHTGLTLLILELNHLLDTGRYDAITVEEVLPHIEDGSILRFLQQRAGEDALVLSIILDGRTYGNFERFYVAYMQSFLINEGGGARRWGVENRGLCLLIAWTNEILQQGSGWSPHPDISGVEYV